MGVITQVRVKGQVYDVSGSYNNFTDLPSINGYTLHGAMTGASLGLANDSSVVHKTENETISGEKTFSSGVTVAGHVALSGASPLVVGSADQIKLCRIDTQGEQELNYVSLYKSGTENNVMLNASYVDSVTGNLKFHGLGIIKDGPVYVDSEGDGHLLALQSSLTGPELFWCDTNTKFAEITEALRNKYLPVLRASARLFLVYQGHTNALGYIFGCDEEGSSTYYYCASDDVWTMGSCYYYRTTDGKILRNDLDTSTQTSLGKADNSLQSGSASLADLSADSTHRVVTDSQINTWDSKLSDAPMDGKPYARQNGGWSEIIGGGGGGGVFYVHFSEMTQISTGTVIVTVTESGDDIEAAYDAGLSLVAVDGFSSSLDGSNMYQLISYQSRSTVTPTHNGVAKFARVQCSGSGTSLNSITYDELYLSWGASLSGTTKHYSRSFSGSGSLS